jgi:beta-lactam-binding protein with PASTA domain
MSEENNINENEVKSENTAQNQESLKEKAKIFGKAVGRKMKKEVKNLPNRIKNIDIKVEESYHSVKTNVPCMLFAAIASVILMVLAATAVFFTVVKGPEKVLVPDVVGKNLEDALLELQVKELYPKINLRYSDTPGDEGKILDQTPEAGSITKGYSRVSLVVSRGVIVDKVDDYIGQKLDEVQMKIQTLFAGQTKPLIMLASPMYKPDTSDAGTILEQDPPAGTSISEPVTVQLVVSRGPNFENTRPPKLVGQTINDLLQSITRHKIVFDITGHKAENGETPGTVVNQEIFDTEFVPNYSRMKVEMALPDGPLNDNIYGIFTQKLPSYPYPVPMRLEATPSEGDSFTIISFSHPGGEITIPYAVPKGTVLSLYVVDKLNSKKVVN